jgi:N-acetyl-anhydromuramyl-L-alanine amidase AmpD
MPGSDGSIAASEGEPGSMELWHSARGRGSENSGIADVRSALAGRRVGFEWKRTEGGDEPTAGVKENRPRQQLATRLRPMAQPRDWSYVVLHHSATAEGSVESIDAEHRQRLDKKGRAWDGIGYHFVVGNGAGMADGRVEPTFRWMEQIHGAHAGEEKYNTQGIGICLIGDFDQTAPTTRQVAATRELIEQLSADYEISLEGIMGHGELRTTNCPGRKFPWQEIVAGRPAAVEKSDPLLSQRGVQSQWDLATRGPWR